jgi:uncharacterized membrane protein YgcG
VGDLNQKLFHMYRKMRLLTAFSMLCLSVASSVSVKDCAPGSIFRISAVDFSPAAPVPGQNGTLHTVYDVPVQVDAGSARYSCTLNGLPVYDEKFDLCSQTTCPITAGTHDDHSISAVPATSGKVACKINWYNTAGTQLLCVQMSMTLDAADASGVKKSLRGAPVVYTPPTVFHSHLLDPVVPTVEMCNITEYDDMWTPFPPVEDEDATSTGGSTTHGGGSSSSSSNSGNNTSSGSGGTSSGGSSSASESRMKALVVRLRGPRVHA